ncbi:hypothetical protein D3C81_1260000 [compost metagenome]
MLDLSADLGGNARQVRARRCSVARAEGEPHAGLYRVGQRQHAMLHVQSDQVPHQRVRAKPAGQGRDVVAGCVQSRQRSRQGLGHGLDRRATVHLQVVQDAVEGGLAVQGEHQVLLAARHGADRPDRLATLRDPRHQLDFGAEQHP